MQTLADVCTQLPEEDNHIDGHRIKRLHIRPDDSVENNYDGGKGDYLAPLERIWQLRLLEQAARA